MLNNNASREKKTSGKSGSLQWKLFYYFLAFTVVFIALLWTLQVLTLNYSYKSARLNEIMKTGRQIRQQLADDDEADLIEEIQIDRDTALIILDGGKGKLYSANEAVIDDLKIRFDLRELFSALNSSGDSPEVLLYVNSMGFEVSRYQVISGRADRSYYNADVRAIIYMSTTRNEDGRQIDLMVISSIVPVEATVSTIRSQLVMITVILLAVSLLLAFVSARNISRPIGEINAKARELAEGNYDTDFNARGYREIEELSGTLDEMARELGKADKMQKELIANVSHDLRTPLTMISGYGELIRDIPEENTPENVQIIIDEANRLTSLVNNMLDISKLQSGNEQLNLSILNCEDLVYGVVNSYQMLEAQGYRIEVETTEESCYIEADQTRIQQVLHNLINNALNHCGQDRLVIIRYRREDAFVRFDVIDHGEGIAEEELDKIWQRYYKAGSNRRFVAGSGIGLSIVSTILDMHSAQYGVSSKLNEGSDFYFRIKCVENEESR